MGWCSICTLLVVGLFFQLVVWEANKREKKGKADVVRSWGIKFPITAQSADLRICRCFHKSLVFMQKSYSKFLDYL